MGNIEKKHQIVGWEWKRNPTTTVDWFHQGSRIRQQLLRNSRDKIQHEKWIKNESYKKAKKTNEMIMTGEPRASQHKH